MGIHCMLVFLWCGKTKLSDDVFHAHYGFLFLQLYRQQAMVGSCLDSEQLH
jgi:hypothetical protein